MSGAQSKACGLLVMIVVAAACGGDDSPGGGSMDAAGLEGGPGLDGARPGDGGVADGSSARDGGGTSGGDACVSTAPPLLDPETLPACPSGCPGAHCVPAVIVPEDLRPQLDDCDDSNECVPDLFIETNGRFLLPSCRSLGDAEGRCLSVCVPQVAAQSDRLPQSSCDEGDLCVPCFDPTTAEPTGVCELACDPGPAEPPRAFDRCCGGLGACVPRDIVPAEQASQLGRDTCAGEESLCAPDALVDGAPPPACRSLGDAEGRCLAECLPAVQEQLDRLPMSTCAMGERCVPCFDPTTAEGTGACSLNGDMPAEPPRTFDRCCSDLGSCVPRSLVPPDQAASLGRDSCTDPEALCAPATLIDGSTRPMACRSVGGSEGRCLPGCLPSIAAQADRLPASTCPAAHLCAPCFDPLNGEDSGACRLNGDMPAEPPFRFERCCGGIGSCVPASLVPPEQASQLGRDTCTDAGNLCAPDELSEPGFRPMSCRSVADVEGRCLPACLPAIGAQADRLPACGAGHLCAPCYDPTDGADTGACRQGGDMPVEPPRVFPGCCTFRGTDRGRCVPPSLVPPERAMSLPQDDCTGMDLCVPEPFLDNPDYVFPGCITGGLLGGDPGACVPDCLPGFFEGLFLTRSTCAAGELCAPCVNPLTGAESGACG